MVTSPHAILFKNILRVFRSNYTHGVTHSGTYHLDGLVAGEVGKQVLADEVGLLVEPLALEHIAFLRGGLTHFIKSI